MRFLLPFVALLSVAQALISPGLLERSTSDICASVDNWLKIPVGGNTITIGNIKACLCLSGIPNFLTSNIIAKAAVNIFGKTPVTNAITKLVTEVGKTCNYPDNAVGQCAPNNACNFICTNGFSSQGGDCECQFPKSVCNGQCGNFPGCPSNLPQRRADTLRQKRMSCDVGFTACGTTGSRRRTLGAYECIDVETNLESCGGCNIPLIGGSPTGQDCSGIPGVSDVVCYDGVCKVHECMPGYTISADSTTCYDENQLRIIQELIENPYKLAVDLI